MIRRNPDASRRRVRRSGDPEERERLIRERLRTGELDRRDLALAEFLEQSAGKFYGAKYSEKRQWADDFLQISRSPDYAIQYTDLLIDYARRNLPELSAAFYGNMAHSRLDLVMQEEWGPDPRYVLAQIVETAIDAAANSTSERPRTPKAREEESKRRARRMEQEVNSTMADWLLFGDTTRRIELNPSSDQEQPYDDSVCYACGVELPENPEHDSPAWRGFCSRVCERVGKPINEPIPDRIDLDEAYALGDGEEAIVYWQSSPHFNGWYLNILIDNTGYMHQLPPDGPYPSKWRADFAGQDAAQAWLYEAEGYWAELEDLPVPLNDPGRHGARGGYLEGWDRY